MNRLLRACRWSGALFLLLSAFGPALAQSTAGYGDWQLHLPNTRARALAEAGNRVYVATEDAFFFYDKELNTTQLLSRRDGLNDVGVNTVGYDPTTQQVLVAYRNANLDLLADNGTIVNVGDIARKTITGSKTINHLSFSKGRAYLSTSFGLVVLDMARREIRDTYSNIGPGGAAVAVYATAVLDNTLFAATSAGVLRGTLTDNLLDYRRWTVDLPATTGASPYQTLTVQGKNVYTARNGGAVLCFNCGNTPWQPLSNTYAITYRYLAPATNGLLIVGDQNVTLRATNGTTTPLLTAAQLAFPVAALQGQEGAYYIADYQEGLLKTTDGRQAERFATNAPAYARSFSVLADARSNTVDIFSGGYNENSVQQGWLGGFFEYKDGRWTNFTNADLPPTPGYTEFRDLVRGARTKDGTLYIATYGNGLLQWKGPWEFRQFTQGTPGSPLRSAIPFDPNYTRITDVAVSSANTVWVTSRHPELANTSGLHEYNPTADTWRTVPYFAGFNNLERLLLDDNDYVWASQSRKDGAGIVAYDPVNQDVRYFNIGNSDLPSNQIYDLVKDRKGDIWVATSAGIAVLADPSSVFLNESTTFQQPFVRGGITDGFRALANEVVKAVAVDGGNRKWFGTNRGLWLFNEDADASLLNFTTENSPLPSNNIVDIEINDRTGDVFVVTDAGVVSYRGAASITEGKSDCAKVSPNPVRTNFTGQVGISGLANNGLVKITDVTGKLVYQTKANGGTIIWNLADYNGRKVQSGVYLVLSADAEGKNGCISKIAVVEK